LPQNLHAEVNINSWQPGPVFDWLAVTGRITPNELRRTFNCGVGMVAIVGEHDVDTAIASLQAAGERAWAMGRIVAGSGEVEYI
jgi:phosphoribosylformylglycinamidine cyclo-ligase